MTRKRVGQGLLEVFSEPCEHCRGRGVIVHTEPVDERRRGGGGGGGNHGGGQGSGSGGNGRRDRDRAEKPAAKEEPESPAAAEADDAEATEGGRSGGRRNRGRRNRGQSGEDRAADDASVVEATRGEQPPAEVGTEGHEVPAAVTGGAELDPSANGRVAAAEPDLGPGPDAVVDTAEAVVTARPRRRRAASRPAGPPS
jgi:ribonuclease E